MSGVGDVGGRVDVHMYMLTRGCPTANYNSTKHEKGSPDLGGGRERRDVYREDGTI